MIGDLLHHVYLESDQFKFDSGDQRPGSRTNITFPIVGSVRGALRHPPEDEAGRAREVNARMRVGFSRSMSRKWRRATGSRAP